MILKSASIIHNPDNKKWAQTYCKDKLAFIIIIKKADNNIDLFELGHLLIDDLIENLLGTKFTNLEHFEKEIKQILKGNRKTDTDISVGVLRTEGNKGFFFAKNITILIARGGKSAVLIDKSGVISGELQKNDTIFLINIQGRKLYGLNYLQRIGIETPTVRESIEKMLLTLHQKEDEAIVVSLLIKIDKYNNQETIQKSQFTIINKKKLVIACFKNILKIFLFLSKLLGKIPKKTLVVILLVILGLILSNISDKPKINQEQFSQSYQLAEHKYEEGDALLELNRLRARDVLKEAQIQLTDLQQKLKEGQSEYKKAKKLLEQINKALTKAQAAYKTKPDLFFELDLVRDGLTASLVTSFDTKAYFYSSKKKLIVVLDLKTKASKVLAGGGELADGKDITASSEKQFIISSKGVVLAGSPSKIVIEKDEDWGEIVDIEYFGGNLYLLDSKGAIWKYLSSADSFSNKKNYLKGGLVLLNPTSMAIDGAVWVIADGKLLKFISGLRDSFYIRGLEQALGKDAKIVKTPDLNNLYILDKANQRIVVISEEGVYQAQYSWEGLSDVDGFIVSESLRKIYLLKKDKVFSFKLQ